MKHLNKRIKTHFLLTKQRIGCKKSNDVSQHGSLTSFYNIHTQWLLLNCIWHVKKCCNHLYHLILIFLSNTKRKSFILSDAKTSFCFNKPNNPPLQPWCLKRRYWCFLQSRYHMCMFFKVLIFGHGDCMKQTIFKKMIVLLHFKSEERKSIKTWHNLFQLCLVILYKKYIALSYMDVKVWHAKQFFKRSIEWHTHMIVHGCHFEFDDNSELQASLSPLIHLNGSSPFKKSM